MTRDKSSARDENNKASEAFSNLREPMNLSPSTFIFFISLSLSLSMISTIYIHMVSTPAEEFQQMQHIYA